MEKNVIVKADTLFSEHEYLFGAKQKKKIIDVKDQCDFPTLELEQ